MKARVVLALTLLIGVVAVDTAPVRASDTSTRWRSFSESSTCGQPYTRTPYVSKQGGLPDSELILGPFGTYLGRSIGEIRSRFVQWTVPGSGGRQIQVHRLMLPALQKVAATLQAEAVAGRVYPISSVAGFTPRTIGGSHQVSRHALGLAIDINPAQNPYRSDNVLISDMPVWFVDAWRSAGFCWGGDWRYAKDPMHFSWMGPGAVGSPSLELTPLPPRTELVPFGDPVARFTSPFAPVVSRYTLSVADTGGSGAPDIVGVRSHPDGAVIDIARNVAGYGECSIRRWFVPEASIPAAQHVLFGDVDGDSGQDLIALSPGDGSLNVTVATRGAEFKDPLSRVTSLGIDAVAVAAADFDGDHLVDLWEATPTGDLQIWRGPGWTRLITTGPLPDGVPSRIAAADRDGGDTPELFALYDSTVQVLSYSGDWVPQTEFTTDATGSIATFGAIDYDGDGRSDVQILDNHAVLTVHVGNTTTGAPHSRWFLKPDRECDDDHVLLSFNGAFFDDENSLFEANIESIAAAGVTRGCNPPFGDRFCPDKLVTRQEMAAFLVRGLGLEENTHPGFFDVPSHNTFNDEIGRLATAGITVGCDPTGTRFCPGDPVTRGQMAAFLVRALDLRDNTHLGFSDVPPDYLFANDIGRLATAGITLGCDAVAVRFCPHGAVTRGEMAAFLDRSGLGVQN